MNIVISEQGIMPIRKHKSAGYDLASPEHITLYNNEKYTLDLQIALHIEHEQLVGLIYPRSSMGMKGLHFLNTTPVIDCEYTGNIKLALINKDDDPLIIKRGDRIAQLVFTHIYHPKELGQVDRHIVTDRNSDGFGSTGL